MLTLLEKIAERDAMIAELREELQCAYAWQVVHLDRGAPDYDKQHKHLDAVQNLLSRKVA